MTDTQTITTLEQERDVLTFVENAAAAFAKDSGLATYGESGQGLLALRWGLLENCVRVVRLDPNFGARLFTDAIPRKGASDA